MAFFKYYRRRRQPVATTTRSQNGTAGRHTVHYMPINTMSYQNEMASRRDSWPPTQVLLESRVPRKDPDGPRPLLQDIDEDPLTYFLAPTTDQDEDYSMDFDAGIEDPNHPTEMVRSVSPSNLDGLSKDRPSSPECDSDVSMASPSGDEEDEEDYIRWSPQNSRLTSFQDMHVDGLSRTRSPVFGRSTNALLSPHSFPAPTPRGRNVRGRPRSSSLRSRPTHLWREPSPDVWSIEEETEEEMMSEKGASVEVDGKEAKNQDTEKEKRRKAAKPKKMVRFVLPAKEIS